ncbi:MAG: apolipoprotein N-acyltransferase [Acidimicrobiales bacterium]|nr:apolipoprotein N-acyltransferase [Acidimicrobiales bacterium]
MTSGAIEAPPGTAALAGRARLVSALGLVGPSGVAGALLALSVPPFGLWPLGAVGLCVLYLRLARQGLGARLVVGFCTAVAWLVPSLWFATAFTGLGFLAMVLIESCFLTAGAALVPPGRGRALAFPGAVTLAEAGRDLWPFGGVPVGGLDLGQADGWLLPAGRLGGHLLIVGTLALAGVALAEASLAILQAIRGPAPTAARRTPPRPSVPGSLVAGLTAAGVAAAAVVAGHLAPAGGPPHGTVRVAAVQGGGPLGLRKPQGSAARVYVAQLVQTDLLRRPVDLVVWPEDVIALRRPLVASPVDAEMGDLARSLGATLLAGVTEPVGTSQFRNFVGAWGPSGRLIGRYEKVHRVPFGEYIPLRGILRHLVNLTYVPRDAIAGHGVGLFATPAGPLGVAISYEVFFAQPARRAVAAGARLLVVPTNDASYATDQLPSQEVAADRLRAVEEGRELVQVAPTGYSTVVDRNGRVLARTALGPPATLERAVPSFTGRTLYSRSGDWPEGGVAFGLVAAGLVLSWRGRHPEGAAEGTASDPWAPQAERWSGGTAAPGIAREGDDQKAAEVRLSGVERSTNTSRLKITNLPTQTTA